MTRGQQAPPASDSNAPRCHAIPPIPLSGYILSVYLSVCLSVCLSVTLISRGSSRPDLENEDALFSDCGVDCLICI